MKRSGCITAITSLFCIVACIGGCSLAGNDFTPADPEPGESDKGILVITLHSGVLSPKTIVPPITMEIASYDIHGTGPDPLYDHFSDPINTTGLLTLSALNPGLWTITVAAKNAAGTIIGHGQTEPPVLLSAGLVTNAQIDILPLAGPGEFNLAVQWPKGAHKNVSAQASLTSMITGQDLAPVFVFTPPGNPETGTYSNSAIEAGYYLLLLRLYNTGVQFWGVAESVRIIAGQTTSQSWVLN
jgi:hypothetical protein